MSLTDAQRLAKLQDCESQLKLTTVGYVNSKWKTPPAGSHWANGLAELEAVIADLQPAPAPAPAPTPTPTYLFFDDFDGAAGNPPDPAKWVVMADQKPYKQACYPKAENAFLDGAGHLVLRTKRDSSMPSGSGPFSGAFVGTFLYGWGWPPTAIKQSFPVPFHVEIRAKMPAVAGAWPALWPMSTDRPSSSAATIYELDVIEARMALPREAGCHQHAWVAGKDTHPWDGATTVENMATNWYVYSADVRSDRVDYFVDGVPNGTAYGVSGRFGLLLDNSIALPGSWGSGGQQPPASDPGPWDMLIDYVRVWAL